MSTAASIHQAGLLFVIAILVSIMALPAGAQIPVENTGAKAYGPVQLREGQRFEVCVNARRNQFGVTVTVSVRAARNANAEIASRTVDLAPGQGGCASVAFAQVFAEVGDQPIFALVTAVGDGPAERDLVGSACVINAIFSCTPSVAIDPVEIDSDTAELTTYGPVRLKPDTALLACATNAFNDQPTEVAISLYAAANSSEPIARRAGTLPPSRGACVEVPYERVRDRPIFAEIRTSSTVSEPRNPTLGSVGVINGIYMPLPGDARLVDDPQ